MTMPFYVPPEQMMKDRAQFAQAGIARGRAAVVLRYADGICFVADNSSTTLHKVSELYDRIGFAAVGRYNEFEALRIAGIQQADVRGFTYSREDVSARSLVNSYAQVMGSVFASTVDKPFEVELAIAELGDPDRIYRIAYDGSVFDEAEFCVMGATTTEISAVIAERFDPKAPWQEAVRLAALALASSSLEVAVLDRTLATRRAFVRKTAHEVELAIGHGTESAV